MKKGAPATRSKVGRSPKPLESPARARTSPTPATTIQSDPELQRVVHELRVHQEELEAQNEELREAQRQLEASRDRYADLYDFAPIGYATLDEKGRIREINLTGATILGWERLRLLGTLFSVAVAKRDLRAFHDHLQQCRQQNGQVTTELALVVPDRNPLHVQLHSIRIQDLASRTTMYRTAITDITARKQAEEKLRQAHDQLEDRVRERTAELGGAVAKLREEISERKRAERAMQQLAAIVESSDDAIISKTLDGVILSWNKGAERIYGYAAEEMIGHPISILFPSDNPDAYQEILRKIKDGEGINLLETARRRKDGKLIHVSLTISPIKDATGKTIAACVIGHDMTKRKRAEEALRASEERQRALFESAPDPIVVVDAEGRMERVNRQAEVMFGYQRSELIGQLMEMLMPERFRGRHGEYRAGYIGSPHLRPMGAGEQRYGRRKDGSEFPVDIMLSPLPSKPGPLVIAVVRDVTGRKQTEQALRQLTVHLLQSQDEERRRIARELHDSTGQKVAALAMNLSVIGKSAETLNARARKALAESLTLVDRSSRDIRTLSYLLHPPLLDERGLAAAVRWFADGFTQRSGVQVDLEVPPELPRLPEEIEMALFRIVQESFTNIHRHSGSSTATIRLAVDQERVQLEIRDAGKGLPKPRSDGYVAPLGVGITGMRERVKQLGGQMKMESNSHGTTVSVTMPLTRTVP